MVTQNKTDLLVSQQILQHDDAVKLMELDNLKFISAAKLEKAIIEKVDMKGREDTLPVISSSFISKGIPARLMTFIFTLMVAVLSTFIIPPSSNRNR